MTEYGAPLATSFGNPLNVGASARLCRTTTMSTPYLSAIVLHLWGLPSPFVKISLSCIRRGTGVVRL